MGRKRPNDNTKPLDRERVLEVLAKQPHAAKRDIARALGVKGSDRVALKQILKELERDGTITRAGKRAYSKPGQLPEVAVLEITGQDPDGELLARPTRWDSEDAPPQIVIVLGREAEASAPPGRGERVLARLLETRNGYEARVIKRLGASVHRVLGVYHAGARDGRIAPIDRKTRYEFIVDTRDNGGAASNELVLAEPLAGRALGLPRARIVERLGSMSAPRAISLIAIHAHGIPTEFSKGALDEAARAMDASPRERTDLRKYPLVTIDPEDARDHDDAVWAGPDDNPANKDGHVVIVAIADVAHYVKSDSELDREARSRGNSAYFPDRVVPMLPERLSADLCSLLDNVDRPCLAVRMVFDKDGNKKHHEFLRATMRSAATLTYQQAQRAFDGTPDADHREIRKATLAPLWNAYQSLVVARDKRDPLALDLPERRVIIGEDGKVHSIAFRDRLESMRVVEELMIQANVAAAESLEKAKIPLLYRVHETPSQEKLFAFADYLRTIGMSFAKGQVVKPGSFNRILGQAKNTPHAEIMNDVVLRTQAQAVYAPDNIGHFGLNLHRYAHFTSPIRRYADLVVHRALIRAFKLGADGLSESEIARLRETADHVSMCERRAMAAERDSTERYVAAYMKDREGATFAVRVTGVTRFGLFVRLKETGAEGLIPARALGHEYFHHDEKRHALIGDRSGTTYSLGDMLVARLVEAAPLTGGLRFELTADNVPKKATKAPPKFQAARKSRRKR